MLRVTPQKVRDMLRKGELVGIKVGDRWVLPSEAVADMLKPITVYLAGERALFVAPPPVAKRRRRKAEMVEDEGTSS